MTDRTHSAEVFKTSREGLHGCGPAFNRGKFTARGYARKVALNKHWTASQVGGFHHAAQSFAQVWRNRMPVVQSFLAHHKFALGIEHYEIRVVTGGNSAFARAATCQPGWLCCHPSCQIG